MLMLSKKLRGKSLDRAITICCSLAFMMFGYDAGILGGVQTTEPFLSAIGHPQGTYIIPMVASSYTLACAVCSVAVMFVGMNLGRRNCILLGNGFVLVGGAMQAASFSVPQIIVARILCGFGVGFITCTVPTYISEMGIDSQERGPRVAINSTFLVSGAALAYWVDFGFTRLPGQISWRFPIAGQCLFAISSGMIMLFLPDTPRWYMAQGRHQEAEEVLCRLHDTAADDSAVMAVKSEILRSIQVEHENENRLSWTTLFWDTTDLRVGHRIRIAFAILSIQQMMGINMLVYYSTLIFAEIGLSVLLSSLLAAILNTIFAVGTVFCIPTIERWGRRRIMLWSSVALTFCMMMFVIMIGLEHKTVATQWTATAFVIVFEFVYGWGWVACPWLYAPEIAPLRYRHVGAAASCVGQWLFAFITVFAGGIAIQRIGWKIWIWQVVFCAVGGVFVYFCCPEVTGKTLEEIDFVFAKPSAVRREEYFAHHEDKQPEAVTEVQIERAA